MARAKKEAALTPEERLQAALVPDWEWPYKLPGNWCWTTVGTICDGFQYGYTEKATFEKIGPHFIRITDIGDGIINDSGAPYCKIDSDSFIKYKINKDDILIARMGSVGENGLATHNIDGVFASYLIRIVPRSNAKYVCNFLQTNLYWGQISEKAQGTTRLNVNANVLKNLIIPLPPLAEQQRIVDRIESLFAKLDEAKEKAQAVLDSFETRKAAILHKAFTGELTAKWREEHGVRMESWEVRTLDSVCSSIFDGDHMPPPKAESGIPFLVISNVNTGHLTFENTRFVPQEYYDTLSDTRKPQLGDVLYTLVGSFGIPVVVNSKRPFCFQRHMALLRPIDVSPQFLWYILQTPEMYDKASSIATGTAQLTVPIKGLRAMTIPRPNIAEQVEIVRILDGFFAREQSAKEAAEAVLDQIDLMKKSILARAFRGELGTNDPSEESAVELLKEIIRRG